MIRISHAATQAVLSLVCLASSAWAQCPPGGFDGEGDHQTADFGYYYTVTGGKFPTGSIPNGDNASGGTFRFILDDPAWARPTEVWTRDDWFPENAGLALTLLSGDDIVYDNNGIEDGSYGDFYTWADEAAPPSPGLYRAYNMANNWDWIYATFFRIEESTSFDTLIGYFDGNGVAGAEFDGNAAGIRYRVGIWSAEEDPSVSNRFMPTCASLTGDVLDTDSSGGIFEVSDTGVVRRFPPGPAYGGATDPIGRLTLRLPEPVTLDPGEYFFSHHVLVSIGVRIDLRPNNEENQVNTNAKQLVPIAILSDDDFDAPALVDIATLVVRGAGVSQTRFDIEDVDGDGLDDLVVYVRARGLQKPSASECTGPAKIRLRGSLLSGEGFAGVDHVSYLGPDCN